MCVCHIHRSNWICDPLNDMRQDGLAQQIEQTVATDISTIQEYKMTSILPTKNVPFPQPRPCHVFGLEDYLPLKKNVWGVC